MTGSQRQAPDVLPLGAVRAALAAASAPAPGRPEDAYAPDNRAPVYPVPVGPPAGDQPGPTTPRAVRPGVVGPGDAPPGPTAAWPPPLCATTSARETLVPMTPADPALETPVAAPVLPGPVGRWLRSHPRAADSGLALFIFLLGSLSTVLQAQNPAAFQAIGVPGLVILALAQTTAGTALALRRARPLATWAVVILVMPVTEILTVLVLDPEKSALLYVSSMLMLTLLIGVPLMLGTLTVRVRTRWAWLAWVASTLAVQVPQIVLERYTFVESAMTLMALALVNMIGVLVGLNARSQRQRLAEVEARSARASLEREQTALLAAANERSRIAREMHDVVAHSLAVMITMADGVAATIDRNPEMAKEALGMLAETGRSALADTRRLVGVLRDDPGATSAPAGHPGAAGVGSGGAGSSNTAKTTGAAGHPGTASSGRAAGPLGLTGHLAAGSGDAAGTSGLTGHPAASSGRAAGTFPGPAAAEAAGTTLAPAGPCTPGPVGEATRAQIGTTVLNAASSGPVGEATGSPSGLSPTGAHNGPGSQAAVPGRTLQATGPGAHDGPLPGPTGVPAGTTTPASGSPGSDRPLPVPTPREPETRAVPLPEFAPPGTVPPVEPSQAVAHLRTQATDVDPSTGDTPLSPAPEQSDLPVLIRRFQAAGVPVDYTWEGRALPGDKGLQLTLYRIAQESLTNILRYAPTTPRVTVRVERHTGTVVLTVENLSAPGSRPVHGSGKGLIGMRERAAVYGGTVQAGPTRTGWQVRAVLRWEENDEGSPSWQIPH